MTAPLSAPRAQEHLAWYALYTKPHAERQVVTALMARGIEVYLPTLKVWRARRRQVEEEAFFACYAFARLDWDDVGVSAVSWTPGLRSVVSSDGQPTPVVEEVIDYIRARLTTLPVAGARRLEPGDRVRIKQGPFKDLDAVFEGHLSSLDRAQVLVEVLGRLARLHIDETWLERY